MKNRIELFIAELFSPIEGRQILRHEIPAITGEIFEITGAEIVDDRETRIGEFFLQCQRKVGANEAGSAGNHEVHTGSGHNVLSFNYCRVSVSDVGRLADD